MCFEIINGRLHTKTIASIDNILCIYGILYYGTYRVKFVDDFHPKMSKHSQKYQN